MTNTVKVAAVILTYNSQKDLAACIDGLRTQVGVELKLIVVDNSSTPEALTQMQRQFSKRFPDGLVTDVDQVGTDKAKHAPAVFLRNPINNGYSAGNNIGARLGVNSGADAVLIINPDVRISDPNYLASLASKMLEHQNCLLAASKITNLEGRDENPLREASFWEEFFWVRQLLPRVFGQTSYVVSCSGSDPILAEKVHGCCLMLSAPGLIKMGYLDEATFLYCEEPILAARVKAAGGMIMVFPELSALHAHVASEKGNPSKRMQQFVKSRLYYLETYSGYGLIARFALRLSYRLLVAAHDLRARKHAA